MATGMPAPGVGPMVPNHTSPCDEFFITLLSLCTKMPRRFISDAFDRSGVSPCIQERGRGVLFCIDAMYVEDMRSVPVSFSMQGNWGIFFRISTLPSIVTRFSVACS